MENSLQELWSLFNFVQPGLLGDLDYFEKEYCKAILRGGYTDADAVDREMAQHMIKELRKRMMHHILRRTKKQLLKQCKLPERNEYIVPCTMTQAQLNVYESYLTDALKYIGTSKQIDHNKNIAFIAINNLRKICNHPMLFFNYLSNSDSKINLAQY